MNAFPMPLICGIDARRQTAVGNRERRTGVVEEFSTERPASESHIHRMAVELPGRVPEDIASDLVASIKGQRSIAHLRLESVVDRVGSEGVAPRPAALGLEAMAHRVAKGHGQTVVVGNPRGYNLRHRYETGIGCGRWKAIESVGIKVGRPSPAVGVQVAKGLIVAVISGIGDGQDVARRQRLLNFETPFQNFRGFEIVWRRIVEGGVNAILPSAVWICPSVKPFLKPLSKAL